jgi:hypothetical protein
VNQRQAGTVLLGPNDLNVLLVACRKKSIRNLQGAKNVPSATIKGEALPTHGVSNDLSISRLARRNSSARRTPSPLDSEQSSDPDAVTLVYLIVVSTRGGRWIVTLQKNTFTQDSTISGKSTPYVGASHTPKRHQDSLSLIALVRIEKSVFVFFIAFFVVLILIWGLHWVRLRLID